jgi:putative endonuclease
MLAFLNNFIATIRRRQSHPGQKAPLNPLKDDMTNCPQNQLSNYSQERKGRKTRLGKAGESFAATILEEQGWIIEARNWRAGRYAEIDIIAVEPSGLLVFIEIKTRRQNSTGGGFDLTGFDAVNKAKQQKIVTSARIYLEQQRISDRACRFDVMVVQWQCPADPLQHDPLIPQLIHVENAFIG